MSERLRRWTANPLGSARAGSNPVLNVFELLKFINSKTYLAQKLGAFKQLKK